MNPPYPAAPKKTGFYRFLGLSLHPVDVEEVHSFIAEVVKKGEQALVLNLNIHCVNLASAQPWLRSFLNEAQLVFCDGDGVRWGLRLLGLNPPPKITYDRWIWQLAEFADRRGLRLYFLGARPGVAEEAALKLKSRFPSLQVVGCHHGYFDREGPENEKVIEKINLLTPDILIMGLGMPVQEKWLCENWKWVRAHVFLTGGAVFDYASGGARRAPPWMIRCHLEWFYRFLQEPRRLFARYFLGIPYFFLRVFLEGLKKEKR